MRLISGINPRFKYHFAVILDKVVVGKRSAARPRTANCSILNIFAKTNQIFDGGIACIQHINLQFSLRSLVGPFFAV